MEFLQKDIVGYEGLYQITSDGKVWSLKSCKFLKPLLSGPKGKEYYYVCLSKNGIKKNHKIHRLVAEAFIPNPNNLPIVNHKDENKKNNYVDNLEWTTYKENNDYGTRKEKMVETRKNNGNCCKTIMCDKNTHEQIQIFETTRDAIRFLGLANSASSNISACIKGRKKSAYGYWWKIEEKNT